MATWFDGYVQANGINIHYHRTGNGNKPAILLLHGITDNGLCWSRVAHDLESDYDLIMTDARGHGRSDGVSTGFSLETLADDAAGVIRELGLQKPYLFGHSMGAITAAAVAARYPNLVRAALLEDPPFRDTAPPPTNKEQQAERARALLQFRELTREERAAQARAANPNWVDEENIPWVDSKAEFDVEVFEHANFFAKPWREAIPQIELPVLLITGNPEQAIVTPEVAQEVAQTWKNCQVAQINGAGHSIHRDRYAEVMQVVRAFLKEH